MHVLTGLIQPCTSNSKRTHQRHTLPITRTLAAGVTERDRNKISMLKKNATLSEGLYENITIPH